MYVWVEVVGRIRKEEEILGNSNLHMRDDTTPRPRWERTPAAGEGEK